MDALMALGWILTHLGRSRRKYPNVDSTSNAISRLTTRFEMVKHAAGQGGGPENLPLLGKNLLQLAGLCVRTVVDMALDHQTMVPLPDGDLGTDPWELTASNGTINVPPLPPRVPPTPPDDGPVDVPDWGGDPSLHKAIAANADVTGGPQSAEAVSNN